MSTATDPAGAPLPEATPTPATTPEAPATPASSTPSAAGTNTTGGGSATAAPASQSTLGSDLKILWHIVARKATGRTHEERLESFYQGQAGGYDAFRRRMLHGRDELFQKLTAVPGGTWVDLGAGTGENAERWGDRLSQFQHCYLVDLSSSLLKIADQRIAARGWTNVSTVHADATKFLPPTGQADLVTMSYSLTMIPDWFAALEQARRMLKPGGTIGIVDFFVSRKYPADQLIKHRWSSRTFWQLWFQSDNVFLSPDHIPFLQSHFETELLEQHRGKLPYLPLVRAPYYFFIGRRPQTDMA